MKSFVVCLLVLLLCAHCSPSNRNTNKTTVYDTTDLCQRCDETVHRALEQHLAKASPKELAAVLCTYAPECAWGQVDNAAKPHALLIQLFELHLEALLEILDSETDLRRAYLLDLLRRPATQPLSQRKVLLQLQKNAPHTAIGQQVQDAFRESVAAGDAQLWELYQDKGHTYQGDYILSIYSKINTKFLPQLVQRPMQISLRLRYRKFFGHVFGAPNQADQLR